MNHRSLRFRLTAWHATLLAAVFLVLGVVLYVRLRDDLTSVILGTEERRARQIGQTLIAPAAPPDAAAVSRTIESLYVPDKANRYIRILRPDGSTLYRSGPPAEQAFDPSLVGRPPPQKLPLATRRERMPDNRSLLIATYRVQTTAGDYLVEVGSPGEPVDSVLLHLALLLGISGPLVLLGVAWGGYVLVSRALRPAAEIAERAEQITASNLSERLPVVRSGDELERLGRALNRMIGRLDDAFQNSQRFVADASHELRTPLTVLRAELEEFCAERPDDAERLGSLLEEVERLAKIVERLFALSRLDAGEAAAEWIAFDLAELASGTAEQLRLLAEDGRLTLTLTTKPAPVRGDRARIKQVIVNLLDNAIKYTPPGGAIHVSVASADGWARLEVADTGVGIPADALPHVFERFFRADPSRSRSPDGAGLGLAIVKAICGAHGGAIEAASALGRGSRFTVRLPLAAPSFSPS